MNHDYSLDAIETELWKQGYIGIFWHLDDVAKVRPDLNEAQCREVLQQCENAHDGSIGLNWDVIEFHAEGLFPVSDEDEEAS